MKFDDYFQLRGVSADAGNPGALPAWLRRALPADRQAPILDLGCGLGRHLRQLLHAGYTRAMGADVSRAAIETCRDAGLRAEPVADLDDFAREHAGRFAFILMSHVLEHLPKDEIIGACKSIRSMLSPGGALCLAVPNAQSRTGCYWAYEDFTHQTMFTSGSLLYVLRAAGFSSVEFLDVDGLADTPAGTRWIKRCLLWAYRANTRFWDRVTSNAYHAPSPVILGWELKAIARE